MSELMVAPSRHGPFPGRLGPDAIAAYAAATGDHTPAVLEGLAVPAVFPVILVFGAQEAARADLPAAAWERARGGVHGEHDIVLHRPLVPDEPLDTWAQISAVRTSRAGTHVVVHLEQTDADGRIAVEQWWTMVLLGLPALPIWDRCPPTIASPKTRGPTRSDPPANTSTRTSPIATPRCPATGRRTISTSTSRGQPDSTSCSPTACARWQSARTAFSACWASTIPAGLRESQCGSLHRHRWTRS